MLLYGTPVTDQSARHLVRMQGLQALNLRSTSVTDQGLRELAGLERLRELSLSFLPDPAVLKNFGALRVLRLSNVNVNQVEEAQRALPDLKVVRIVPNQR